MTKKWKITTYEDCCGLLEIVASPANINKFIAIENRGYLKSGICYTVWKSRDRLNRVKTRHDFWSILLHEVASFAFRK